ncbi:MAG: UbiD family decarboxylase [Chloroflexi bacterium]|nr:UbiD family decarboxylase [Chloroflexota bacterium]
MIAGECPPPDVEARDEGPFAEWTGYYASGMRPEPVIHVRALYHRDDPIIFGCAPFKSRDSHIHFGLPASGKSEREELTARGIPDVLDVVHLGLPGFHVIQIRQRYPGHAMQAALAMTGKYMGRFVVVVDEDINPHDPEDVLWAMGTRCDPASDITTVPGGRSSWLDPRLEPEKKRQGDFTSSRAIVLAVKPYHWKDQFPKTNVASPELRAQIMGKWREVIASK